MRASPASKRCCWPVYDRTQQEFVDLITAAVITAGDDPAAQLRAAIATTVKALAADPRRARLGFTDPAGSPALEQRRHDGYQLFAELGLATIRTHVPVPHLDEITCKADVLFALGGIGELLTTWLNGALPLNTDQLTERLTTVCMTIAQPYLHHSHHA